LGEARRRMASKVTPDGAPLRKALTLLAWFAAGFAASVLILLIPGSYSAMARAMTKLGSFVAGDGSDGQGNGRRESADRRGGPIDGLIEKGYSLISEEHHAEAFGIFLQASRLAPDRAEPHWGLALVYHRFQLFTQEERSCRKAIQLDSTCRPAKEALARILCDLGRNEESLAILRDMERDEERERARPKEGTSQDKRRLSYIWGEVALNLLRTGKPGEAIPSLERYIAAEPGEAWGPAHLGRAFADLGDWGNAEASLRRALELDPHLGLAHLWLGQALIATGRRAEGEGHLKTFNRLRTIATQEHRLEGQINRSPDDPRILVQLARVRALLGKHKAALVPLERALTLNPGDEDLRSLYREIEAKARTPGAR